MASRPRRSALYMPGSNLRALEKAKSVAADVVIMDLEDAVAPDAKLAARTQVMAAVAAGGIRAPRGGRADQRPRHALGARAISQPPPHRVPTPCWCRKSRRRA